MNKIDRWQMANKALEELESDPNIFRLNPLSDFREISRLFRNFFDRYSGMFLLQDQRKTLFLESYINSISKWKNVQGDATQFEFVKSQINSSLLLIRDLLANEEIS